MPAALIIGPLVPDFDMGYNRAVANALQQAGYQTEVIGFYVTTPPGVANRVRIDLAHLVGLHGAYEAYVRSFNAEVLEAYRRLKPDLVLVIRGSKLTPATLEAMRDATRLLWFHDAMARSQMDLPRLRQFDGLYVFEPEDVEVARQRFNLAVKFLPLAFDPAVYQPLTGQPKTVDLVFVGTFYPARRAVFEWLVGRFPGKVFRFYGRHVRYQEPATWSAWLRYQMEGQGATYPNRSLQPVQINQAYASARICLNMHHEQTRLGCNPRVFEILGAGGLQLVDDLPYVREVAGDAVLTYSNRHELADRIDWALNNPAACEALVQVGRQRVLAQHTFAQRMGDMLRDHGLPVSTFPTHD